MNINILENLEKFPELKKRVLCLCSQNHEILITFLNFPKSKWGKNHAMIFHDNHVVTWVVIINKEIWQSIIATFPDANIFPAFR